MLGESMSKSVAAAANAPRAKSLARNKILKKKDQVQPAEEGQVVHHDQAPTHLAQTHDASVIAVSETSLEGDFSFAQVLADAQASEASFYTDAGASMGGTVSFLQDDTTSGGSDEGSGASTALLVGGGLLAAGAVIAVASDGDDDEDSNTAPTVTAGQKFTGAEDTVITGKLAATDAQNDTLTFKVSGTAPAGVTIATDGTITLDAKNAAYQSLAAGKTQDVKVDFTVTDAKGLATTSSATVTVTGVNDAPTVTAVKVSGAEDTSITGKFAATDVDGDTLTYALKAGSTAPAGFVLNADGSFSLDAKNAAYQGLNAGQTQDVTANVTVSDGKGGTVDTTAVITVTGVTDGPATAAVTLNAATTPNSTTDADNVNTTYTVQAGNYSYTINGFDAGGDKLVGPAGTTPTVINSNFTDGKVTVQWAIDGNNIIQVTLADLTVAQDQQIFGLTSLNNTLGAGTIA